MAALAISAIGVAAGIGFGAANIAQSASARSGAARAARRQQQAQEALLEQQRQRQTELESQRRLASERDARVARRQRQTGLSRAGQGSQAILGTPLAAQAGVQSGGKTLLGL